MNGFLDFFKDAKPDFGPLAPLMQNTALMIISFVMAISVVVGLIMLLASAIKFGVAKQQGDPHGIQTGRSGLLWSVVLIMIPVVYVAIVLAISAAAGTL